MATDTSAVLIARLQPPRWLSSAAWDLNVEKAISGWRITFRPFHLVPDDSAVFRYAREGNWPGLRQLFDAGLASPYDRDQRGRPITRVRTKSIPIANL